MPGVIAILITNIIWGAAPPIFKFALQDIPPFTLAFIRFFTSSLIFLPFIRSKIPTLKPKYWIHIILGAMWGISINVAFFFLGLKYAPSINVHILSSLAPIVLYVLSLVILKEKPHLQIIKGMMVSLVGVSIVIFAPIIKSGLEDGASFTLQSQLIGNACFFMSMLGAVLISIHYKKIAKEADPSAVTGIQFFIGSLPFIPFMLPELQNFSFSNLSINSWVGIIYGIFFSSALAYFLHNYALTKMSAQEIGVYNYLMPVVAVIVAIPLLGEYPDVFFLLGAVLVLFGMWVSERHPHYNKMHKQMHKKLHK